MNLTFPRIHEPPPPESVPIRMNNPAFRMIRNGGPRAKWQVLEDFRVEFVLAGSSLEWVVPKGYVTDFASVPRLLWWFVSPTDRDIAMPAVLHDWLCDQKTSSVSRFLADAVLRELMLHRGAHPWRRLAVFYAVRWYAILRDRGRDFTSYLRRRRANDDRA